MKTIEKSGNSIDELKSQFRAEYGLMEWELDYVVVDKGSSGFLGFIGKRQAVLRFNLPDPGERIHRFITELMEKLELGYGKIEVYAEGKTYYAIIHDCKDPGFLIGKNGSMLETLQY
ncbi:MAG: Jag N-terminal domain-containing protein, partial [Candidatus Cloacimonadaceae bacterium]|nr:Jag N-terminal domain-containing protein [Candidatus Cloacimonadaceae bacterium]